MHILLLSRYTRQGASSRLRFFQYLPSLQQAGIKVTAAPFFCDEYVHSLYSGITPWRAVLRAYWARLRMLFKAKRFDLVWLEYETLPWLPGWLELALLPENIPLVVDYDDAIFHRYDQHRSQLVSKLLGGKIATLMRRANIVTAGNDYLAQYAINAGAKRVVVLPTVVDAKRYAVTYKEISPVITIGWIGQQSTVRYLEDIAPALQKIADCFAVRIVLVGPRSVQLANLPVEIRPWSETTEADLIQQFDIGIMPLTDSLWERGKCGYKLIQYMACGLPVVASAVGVNRLIVQPGVNGFLAKTPDEWFAALKSLCEDAWMRKRMGEEGRKMMENNYSLQVMAPKLIELLNAAVKT